MDKIAALDAWRDSPMFQPEERLALEYAEAMTVSGQGVDDHLRSRLKLQWDDNAIVELTGLIAFQTLSSKFNAALDVPPQGLPHFRLRHYRQPACFSMMQLGRQRKIQICLKRSPGQAGEL